MAVFAAGSDSCPPQKSSRLVKAALFTSSSCLGQPVHTLEFPLEAGCFCWKDGFGRQHFANNFTCSNKGSALEYNQFNPHENSTACSPNSNSTLSNVSLGLCQRQEDTNLYIKLTDFSCCSSPDSAACHEGIPGYDREELTSAQDYVMLISGIVYLVILVAIIVQVFYKQRKMPDASVFSNPYKENPKNIWILVLVCLAFFVRGVWMIEKSREKHWDFFISILMFTFNRLALSFFFTAFFMVVLGWKTLWALIHGHRPDSKQKFVRIVVFLYGSQLVVALVAVFDREITTPHSKSIWYSVDMMFLALLNIVLSVPFFRFGNSFRRTIMRVKVNTAHASDQHKMRQYISKLNRLHMFLWVGTFCFVVRFCCFLFGELIHDFELASSDGLKRLGTVLYPTFYYTIPELVPGVGLLFIIAPSNLEESGFSVSSFSEVNDTHSSFDDPFYSTNSDPLDQPFLQNSFPRSHAADGELQN